MIRWNHLAWRSPPWLNFTLLALAFGMSYTQFPLYHLSQNQYFFHGLARAGFGLLRNDWLANTKDSWPVFSALVNLTYHYMNQRLVYLYDIALLGIYAYSLLGIASSVFGIGESRSKSFAYLAVIAALHSPVLGGLSTRMVGFNLGGQLMSGVALQTLLGDAFEPATFGALLLLSIHLFLRGKTLLSVISASLAATVHPTYLLSAGVLTVAYMGIVVMRGKSLLNALGLGAYAAALVLPMLLYVYVVFRPTSPDIWANAQAILVNFRFPHHATPARWFGPMVLVKVGVALVALYLVRRTELFWIMLLLFLAAVGLTVTQVLSGSNALAVLFPWRLSVLLLPLATSMIVAYLLSRFPDGVERRFVTSRTMLVVASVVLLAAAVGTGAVEMVQRFGSKARGDKVPMMAFVRGTKGPGDTYLIPRYWEDFRLFTGAPAFVDFNFIPYNDVAVIEWHKRVRLIDAFFGARGEDRCRRLREISAEYRITHVVLTGERPDSCGDWKLVFNDRGHWLYDVAP